MATPGYHALVLLDHEQNRNRLSEFLRLRGLEVSEQADRSDARYDLCFVDARALGRLRTRILQMKQAAQPFHLPCLLVGRREHNTRSLREYSACVDHVVATPLRDEELQLHVEAALRIRRDSITLNEKIAADAQTSAAVPIAAYQADAEGNVVYMNERWSDFTGLPPERAHGIGWKDAVHPEDAASLVDRWRDCTRNGEKFSAELRYRKPDGAVVWASAWAEPQRSGDGRPTGYIGAVVDIGLLRQAREARNQEQCRLRHILDALPVGVWIMDHAGNIVHGNEAARRIWADAGGPGSEYKAWWPATGKRIEAQEWAGIRALRTGETTIDEEIEIERFDGKRTIILNSAAPLYDDERNIVGAIFVNQDIGERKRAEEELRTHAEILANMAEGVVVTDDAGKIYFTNTATQRMYGYSAQELIGMHLTELKAAAPQEARWMSANVIAVLKERGQWSGEYESRRKNGEIFTAAAHISRIVIGGKPYLVSVQQDVTELKKAEEIGSRLAAIVQSSDDAIVGETMDGTILSWNPGAQKMYGYASEEICGRPGSVLDPPGRQDDAADMAARLTRGEAIRNFETKHVRKDGAIIDVSVTISPIKDSTGKVIGVAKIARDITRKRRVEERLRLWGRAIEASSNGIMIIDATAPDQPIIYANAAFQQITGYAPQEVVGCNPRFLQGDERDQPGVDEIRAALSERREARVVLLNFRKDGEPFWNELSIAPVREADGRVAHFIGVLNDITERRRYEAELEYQATHDTLTGLPNRALLQDRLQQAIAHAHRDEAMAAVLFIDLDRFKVVNDSMGHDAGDELLCRIASRLRSIFRAGDTVARQGGDEFVVVLERIEGEKEAVELAQRVLHSMVAPLPVGEQQFYATCSIGIALYPKDGTQAPELLKNADAAMYRAKAEGRNTFRFYAAEMNARALLSFEMEAAMRGAIEREEFVLHFQPQVDLGSGQLIGFEALVRWLHPHLGLLSPGAFIGLAEETGMVVPIGEWVLREACRQARAWQELGLGKYFVAVNLSARQFSDSNLIQQVDSALKDAGLGAEYLELELTESLLMENPEATAETLRRLRARGLRLSIDDFGTGYSSLGYLKRFPLDKLKIDHSFVRDIVSDPDDAAIATAIIAMAHRLKLKVVAEGVETEGQLAYMRSHHCDQVQGFLFSRPLPADECIEFLRRRPRFERPPLQDDARRTLLIVDDEPGIAEALRRSLADDGYRILAATNADEGFEVLARNKVDLVIAGRRMPEMSCAEFLARVRDLHPATMRMVLARHADIGAATEEIDKGVASQFLVRPWDDQLLQASIADAFAFKQRPGG